MAKRIQSGLKRLRQSLRRAEHNRAVRSRIKTLSRRARAGDTEALLLAIKAIDKAAARGIIHKNTAARRKARLVRRHREALAAATAASAS